MWTHNHRLVKYMYMSMSRCDARLQAVPNPFYNDIANVNYTPKTNKVAFISRYICKPNNMIKVLSGRQVFG